MQDNKKEETIDISRLVLPTGLINRIPAELIKAHQFIPLSLDSHQFVPLLTCAFSEMPTPEAITSIEYLSGYKIKVALAPKDHIQSRLKELFPDATPPIKTPVAPPPAKTPVDIKCPTCSNPVSSDITICPHCGRPFQNDEALSRFLQQERHTKPSPSYLGLAGAVLMAIGCFMPVVTVKETLEQIYNSAVRTIFDEILLKECINKMEKGYISGDGVFILILAVISAVGFLSRKNFIALICAIIAGIILINFGTGITGLEKETGFVIELGTGFFLMIAGDIIIVIGFLTKLNFVIW